VAAAVVAVVVADLSHVHSGAASRGVGGKIGTVDARADTHSVCKKRVRTRGGPQTANGKEPLQEP